MPSVLTITTAATDRSLLTIEELRLAAGVKDSCRDPDLLIIGNQAAGAIVGGCNIRRAGAAPATLRRETLTETWRHGRRHHHGHPKHLMLSRRPVVSIASVTVDDVVLSQDEYLPQDAAGILTRLRSDQEWPWFGSKTVVVYDAGFETVPDDLKLAASKMVRLLSADNSRDPYAKRIEIPDVELVDYWVGPINGTALPDDVTDILQAGGYVNEVVA